MLLLKPRPSSPPSCPIITTTINQFVEPDSHLSQPLKVKERHFEYNVKQIIIFLFHFGIFSTSL